MPLMLKDFFLWLGLLMVNLEYQTIPLRNQMQTVLNLNELIVAFIGLQLLTDFSRESRPDYCLNTDI